MANYPQELAKDAVCQSHTGHMTGLWFLPTRPLRLYTDDDDDDMYIYIYNIYRIVKEKFCFNQCDFYLNTQTHLYLHAPPALTFKIFHFVHPVRLWVLCDFCAA